MKFSYKITAILLVLILSLGMLASCGEKKAETPAEDTTQPATETPKDETKEEAPAEGNGNFNETGMPIVNEKVVQSMAFVSDAVYTTDLGPDMYFFQKMEERTNVNFDFEKLTPDQWAERRNLMFAANELPEIMVGQIPNGDIVTYSQAGQIIPLNNLIEKYMPDYSAVLEKFADSAKLYAPDGEMYGLVNTYTGGSAETPGARAFINKKWADNLGMDMPKTYDEFYDLMVAFRDQDPDGNGVDDTIPLSGYSDGYTVDCFVAGPLGIMFGSRKEDWQIIDNELKFVVYHPQYKTYLENMNQLYEEGLLDQEYFTQNDAQMKAKGENMQLGAYTYAAHFVLTGSTDPEIYDQYVVPEPLTSEAFDEKIWYGQATGSPIIFLSNANENPEITLRYFNEIYNEDGAELLVGPVDGEWGGPGGRVWNEDKTGFTYNIPEDYNGIWDWVCREIAPVQSFQGYMQFSDIKSKEIKSAEDASFKDAMEKNVAPYLDPGAPILFFTQEETEKTKLIEDSVITYARQMEAKIIMGEEPLDSVDTMIAELENMGIAEMTEVYNAAYARYLSNISN